MCAVEADITELIREFSKIVGYYYNFEELINAIQEKIRIHQEQSAMFNLYDEEKQSTARDLNRESGSFLFIQLFYYMAMNTKNTDELKQQIITKCRIYYDGNRKQIDEITRFEQT